MTVLEILDQDQAQIWKAEVQRLNEETSKLLEEVGKKLQEVQADADSTIVDELYHWGTQMITASTEILKGMNELVTAVTSVLKKVNEVLDSGKNVVKGIIKGIGDFLG